AKPGTKFCAKNNLLTSRKNHWSLLALLLCCLSAVIVPSLTGASGKKNDGPTLSQPLTIAWRYHTDQTTDLTPAADSQTVFFPLSSGVIIALNTADGKLQWRAEVGGDFSAALAADDRSVYAATRYSEPAQKNIHGTLRALSKSTGLTLWMR